MTKRNIIYLSKNKRILLEKMKELDKQLTIKLELESEKDNKIKEKDGTT